MDTANKKNTQSYFFVFFINLPSALRQTQSVPTHYIYLKGQKGKTYRATSCKSVQINYGFEHSGLILQITQTPDNWGLYNFYAEKARTYGLSRK